MNNDMIGTRLGKYEIRAEIGRGRTGIAYEAHDFGNDRPVVVKVLAISPLDNEASRRFEQHAQALTRLNHPNILKVYDYGVEPKCGLAYLVLPFIGGGMLDDRLGEPWPIEEAVRIAAEVARALDYAHQYDVVHGDVRPGNILLTEGGWALLTDFGMGTSQDIDTQRYWAPERLPGNSTSPAFDLYALSVVLYEMLTGHTPFPAEDFEKITQQKLNDLPSLHELRNDVPKPLEKIVSKMLSPKTEQRHATAVELARDLENSLPASTLSPGQRARSITPPSGVRAGVPPSQPETFQKAATVQPGRRMSRFLWRATKWFLGKIIAALVVLALVAVALLIGGAFALSAVAEQALMAQNWSWGGWENGGVSVILEQDLQQPLQEAVEPYALGALNDLSADFRSPDAVRVLGSLNQRSLMLEARLSAQQGVLQIQLERLNGVPLYIVGGVVSNGVNDGLRSCWEDAPVRLTELEVQEDRIRAVLEP